MIKIDAFNIFHTTYKVYVTRREGDTDSLGMQLRENFTERVRGRQIPNSKQSWITEKQAGGG